ncbi:MAG: ribonuclease [Oscillospiraceae bacterium]|nr:ribonuclease [Oscillospiraceae bacterium]
MDSAATPTAAPAETAASDVLSLLDPSAASEQNEADPPPQESTGENQSAPAEEELLEEDGSYTTKEDVSLYLRQYGRLPSNFITKKEAEKAGWNGGSLERVLPGKCIGGDYFGNYEERLPKAKGRTWRECDINTLGKKSRGAERLLYSNDGLIYYTSDHYESFTQLY